MRDAPVGERHVVDVLREAYGVRALHLEPLGGGLDHRAWTYRVDAEGRTPLVVRLATAAPAPEVTACRAPGAVIGLLAGLLFVALTDSIDNPFWAMAIGISTGATGAVVPAERRER